MILNMIMIDYVYGFDYNYIIVLQHDNITL